MTLLRRVPLVVGVLLAGAWSPASAELYRFEQVGTGDVLALMELDDAAAPGPFDHTDVLSFAFTGPGNSFFGLGIGPGLIPISETPFPFQVDASGFGLSGAPADGLTQTGLVDFAGGPALDRFRLSFDNPTVFTQTDILLSQVDGGGISASGEWTVQPVPEPGSLTLFGMAFGLLGCGRRTRRRKQTLSSD